MPFVTISGGLELSHDVVEEKCDPDGRIIRRRNGKKNLYLGCAMQCDFNPRSRAFREIVWRGTPDKSKMMWINGEMPVWRVPTNRFSNPDFLRLVEYFELNQTQQTRLIHYEPNIKDIEVSNFGPTKGFHFPLWVIEDLLRNGHFEQAMRVDKVHLPGEKKLTEEEYEDLMLAIEVRREQEEDLLAKMEEKERDQLEEADATRKDAAKRSKHKAGRAKALETARAQKVGSSIEDRKSGAKGAKKVANIS